MPEWSSSKATPKWGKGKTNCFRRFRLRRLALVARMLGKSVIHCLNDLLCPSLMTMSRLLTLAQYHKHYKCTNWAVNVWADWRANRCKITNTPLELPPHLLVCSAQELDGWMSKFVLEARRRDGLEIGICENKPASGPPCSNSIQASLNYSTTCSYQHTTTLTA